MQGAIGLIYGVILAAVLAHYFLAFGIKFIKASASPPIYFELVKLWGNEYADAGIINNYAITQAIQAGCDFIFMLTPTKVTPKKIESLLDVINTTIEIATQGYKQREIGCVERINDIISIININLEPDYKNIPLVIIEPDKPVNIDLLNFDYKNFDRRELLKYGYSLAKRALELVCH